MAITTKGSRSLGVSVFSATPFETRLVKQTIKERFSKARIGKLVGDRAYDSDPLDKELKTKGVELIAPHKKKENEKERRMHVNLGSTKNVGRLSVSLPGCKTSEGVLLDGNINNKTFWHLSTSQPSLCF